MVERSTSIRVVVRKIGVDVQVQEPLNERKVRPVELPEEPYRIFRGAVADVQKLLPMLGPERLRRDARVTNVVQVPISVGDSERREDPREPGRRPGHDRARVEAPRQERADRNIRDEVGADGVFQPRPEFFDLIANFRRLQSPEPRHLDPA